MTDVLTWREVADQVVAGQHDTCDAATRESFTIGLRSRMDRQSIAAVKRLEDTKDSYKPPVAVQPQKKSPAKKPKASTGSLF